MRPDKGFAPGGDRVGDLRASGCGTKPRILERRTLRRLCLASLMIVLYCTLGPLGSGPGPWLAPAQQWHWVPPVMPGNIDDVSINVGLYVPVGIAFRLLLRRRGGAGWLDFAGGLGLSAALSYATEVLQQFLPGRVSSMADVAANGCGALIGCCSATLVQSGLRRLHSYMFTEARSPQRLWALLAGGSLLVTTVLMTAPWRLARPKAELGFDQPFGEVNVQRLATFAVLGFLLAGALLARRAARTTALAKAGVLGIAAAVGLECMQLVLAQHVCSLRHAVESVLGVCAGAGAAAVLLRPTVARATGAALWMRAGVLLGLGAMVLWIGGEGLWRDLAAGKFSSEPAVDWVPFHAQFHAPSAQLLTELMQQMAAYSLLTAIGLILALDRGRETALLLLLAVVGARECALSVLSGHQADTTAPVLAIVAWLATTRVWQSLRSQMRVGTGCA